MTVELARYRLSFSTRDLLEGLFAEIKFSKELPNLKMVFSIALNLVSKLRSCRLAATDIAETGFILTIPDPEENVIIVTLDREKSDNRIAVNCG